MTASFAVETPVQDRGLEERRKLGAYYTPERLSQILSDWAIRSAEDTVLEPSFGGCGFLATARDALSLHGAEDPVRQIFGCDVDPIAFQYLANTFGSPLDLDGFLQADFLDCSEAPSWPRRFSVVLANPPYIPHHRIGKDRVKELSRRSRAISGVGGRASLWAYFLAHAVSLLEAGGRMAWVLPGAFLQADYAEPIRRYLGQQFKRCAAFLVRERLFLTEGTDEETVILLADGHLPDVMAGGIEIGYASTIDELEQLIELWSEGAWQGATSGFSPATLSMPQAARSLYEKISKAANAETLGDLARVQIGLVTGDNRFFVLDRRTRDGAGLLDEDCIKVVSKFRAVTGILAKPSDLDDYAATGGRIYLVSGVNAPVTTRIGAYLATFDPEKRKTISTFKKRPNWSETFDGKTPDAFLPVMHHTGPRLVLNPEGYNCTNTIHRVFFHAPVSDLRRKVATLSLLTTYSQISAELCGRRYGSGVLKHEPRDAERINLLMPEPPKNEIVSVLRRVDARLRRGDAVGARVLADEAIYRWAGLAMTKAEVLELEASLTDIRNRRRPNRQVNATDGSTSGSERSSR